MGEISGAQLEELKEAFQLFDKDQDGKITGEELGTVMRAVGQNPSQAEIKELTKTIGGSTGLITLQNFIALMQKRNKVGDNEEQTREAFKVFDKNGTGLVEIAELRHVLTTLGEKLTVQEVDSVMKEADTDGDGKISLQDFVRVMKSAT